VQQNATERYSGLEQQLRKLNGAVESMAYNIECLSTANDALVNLSHTMACFVAATDAVRSSISTVAPDMGEKANLESQTVSATVSPAPPVR